MRIAKKTLFSFGTEKTFQYLLIITLVVLALVFRISHHHWEHIVENDGRGYYAYLPAIFKYHDLKYEYFFNGQLRLPANYTDNFLFIIDGHYVIKYPPGVAVLLSPFYLLAQLISFLAGMETDGYSFFYQVFVSVGALFYAAIGGKAIANVLKANEVSSRKSALLLLLLFFGTNLTNYIIYEPSMSHVYSFSMVAIFLWQIKQFEITNKGSYLLRAAIAFGLVVLIRPVNGIVIFAMPIVFHVDYSIGTFILRLLKHRMYIIGSSLLFLLIVLIQPLLWKLQNGHWYVWTYLGESFQWGNPSIRRVLFSYRKGWFVYTPAMLLLVPALITEIVRKNWSRFFSAFFFWCCAIYMISSWWCWYYGGSFGQRAFVEFYPVAIIGIAYFYDYIGKKVVVTSLFMVLCMFLNLIQSYQYQVHILHYDSMDKVKYWQVFLRTGSEYQWRVFINPHQDPPIDIASSVILKRFNDFEDGAPEWVNQRHDNSDDAVSGNHCVILSDKLPFSPMVKESIAAQDSSLGVRVKGFIRSDPGPTSCIADIELRDSTGIVIYHKELNCIGKISSDYGFWSEFDVYSNLPVETRLQKLQLSVMLKKSGKVDIQADDVAVFLYKW